MLLIPAIDLKDGRCVRLKQGKLDEETIFSEDPAEVARRWRDEGAERIHLVDLNEIGRASCRERVLQVV